MCISFGLGCVLFDKMIQFILSVKIYTMEIFQHIKAKVVANWALVYLLLSFNSWHVAHLISSIPTPISHPQCLGYFEANPRYSTI